MLFMAYKTETNFAKWVFFHNESGLCMLIICHKHMVPSEQKQDNSDKIEPPHDKTNIKLQAMQNAPPLQLYPASDKFLM